MRIACRNAVLATAVLLAAVPAGGATAQEADLSALVEAARAANPEIAAAARAADAARARARAAGILPDPRLAAGVTNALVSDPLSSGDMMTMRMIELGVMLPYPGKLGLEKEIARWVLSAAQAERQAVELQVVADVKRGYYEIWFLDRALDVFQANEELLSDFVTVTGTRYGVGTGGQADILKAQVERTRVGDEILDLQRRRATAVAELNALLDRPSPTAVPSPSIPAAVERAAVPPPGSEVRITAIALGEAEPAGPIPDLATLQRAAEASNPRLAALAARIEAGRAAERLAELAALPDFDLMVGYGQRSGREDMASVSVSVPLPLFKGRKQDALAEAANADVAALEAERLALANEVRADVARLHAALLRTRDRVALVRDGVLPQARASLESAIAGYGVASVDFLTLVDSQATLFRHELDYHDLVAGFARDLAALEQTVGREVLR